MAERYFVETPITGRNALLEGVEAHHLVHVMRAKPGDRVVLFDGSGVEFPARVESIGRGRVELNLLGREEIDRELPLRLILGVSLPKGDRQRWLVEKAVELGASRIVPLETARSVARPTKKSLDRLRRTVIEASKQCRRNRLMEIAQPQPWADFATQTPATSIRLLAHPCGHSRQSAETPANCPLGSPEPVLLAVGPEGGFSEEEISLAATAGWQLIDLGPRILRVETAAILLLARLSASTLPKAGPIR